jgi:hypothetical protein
MPHRDRPYPGVDVPLEVRDVHEDLAPVTGDAKEVKKGGVRWKRTMQAKLSLHNAYAYYYMRGPWYSLRWGGEHLLNSF